MAVTGLDAEKVERYLKSLLGKEIELVRMAQLGKAPDETVGKSFGYGTPVRIGYRASRGEQRSAVLHTMSPGPFGPEHMADRAHTLIWSHQAFNHLPRHVRSLDVGGFEREGNLRSLDKIEESYLLTEYAEGVSYVVDLERIRDTGTLTDVDLRRADVLCDYLAEIHSVAGNDPGLYVRRNRELVGDGECIVGLADSYPRHPSFTPQVLQEMEQRCVSWRWQLKGRTRRLCQVHGDFLPWNVLFEPGVDFRLLDRSRGEYGDPADDITSLTLNYVFFSLQRTGRLDRGLEMPFMRFWERYLEKSCDSEILQVVAPFFAFRGLVMASPVWYPALADDVRRKLLAFILSVLESTAFDPIHVNAYCERKNHDLLGHESAHDQPLYESEHEDETAGPRGVLEDRGSLRRPSRSLAAKAGATRVPRIAVGRIMCRAARQDPAAVYLAKPWRGAWTGAIGPLISVRKCDILHYAL
jgi:hypothetical protein